MSTERFKDDVSLPLEERQRRLFEYWAANPIRPASPRSWAIAIAVDAQTAANAKARPEDIRIVTRDESGAARIMPLHHYCTDGVTSIVGRIQQDQFTPEKAK
jgi:hypothetical protein